MLVEKSFDIELIYEYLESIYHVILKIIYKKSIESLVGNIDDILDYEYCKEIVSQLQLMNCPTDLIIHFNTFLSVLELKSLSEDFEGVYTVLVHVIYNVITLKLNNISTDIIDLPIEKIEISTLTIEDIMETLLGDSFKQFWWIFNLLRNESEKKSFFLYDTSLNLFPKNVMFRTEHIKKKYEYSCDVLTSIYCNLFYIKSKNNKYLSSKRIENIEGIKFCFRKINHCHIKFTSNFLQMLEKWSESDYLNDNDDLLDIFLITIIHLRNESNIRNCKYLRFQQKIELASR